MSKTITSIALTQNQLSAVNEKAKNINTSRSQVIRMGIDLICHVPDRVLEKINQAAVILNTDANTVMLNLITARVAQIQASENNFDSFPELTNRRLDLAEATLLIK